jgi:hypothetical protein
MTEKFDFNSDVASMSEGDLNNLFEGTPSIADLDKLTNEDKLEEVKLEEAKIEDLFDDESLTEEEKAAKLVEAKKLEEEKAKSELTEEQKAKLEQDKLAEQKLKEEQEAKKEILPQIQEALKNTVDYLVSSGQWADFEGREDLEVTEEVYAKLVVEQDKLRVNSMFDELLDSTGDYGKAIITHIQSGGNPDDVIDIFKEQKALDSIDTSTDDGKILKVEKYYKEVLGWKQSKVENFVKGLITDDKLTEEFTDVEELYNKHYKQQLEQINKETEDRKVKAEEKKQEFTTNIKAVLDADSTLTPKDKKRIQDSILDFKHNIGDGKKVSDFYLEFAKIQQDPKQYVDLVKFVIDKETYLKAFQEKIETQVAKKEFSFIKGNAAVKKAGTSKIEETGGGKQGTTNFSLIIKK